MKRLAQIALVMCLMAGFTLDAYASNTAQNQEMDSECPGVNSCCPQRVNDHIRERAENFAKRWPAEIKQQWIQLITSRTDIICTDIDIIERLFLPTFYPANIAIRKQRFEVLDAQLTLLFADLLLEPSVRAIVQDLSEKEIFPNDLHRQRAKQFCYESRRLQVLLGQDRRAEVRRQNKIQLEEQVDYSAMVLKSSEPLDESTRLIAIGINSQGERYCYIAPFDEQLKPGDPFQAGQIQTISDEGVTYTQGEQTYSLSLDL